MEYVLLLAFVAAVAVGALTTLGATASDRIKVLGTQFERAPDGTPIPVWPARSCSGNSAGKANGNANNCHDKT